jgi:hypothetical protein
LERAGQLRGAVVARPAGYFRILDVRSNGDPRVLVVEPTERIAPGELL